MTTGIRRTISEIGSVLFSSRGPRLSDDDTPTAREEFITRRMRELRMKERRFEIVICQVDRTTGEIIIPKRTRGMIAALRRQAEHRAMGWIAACFIAILSVAGFRQDAATTVPRLERRPISRTNVDRVPLPVVAPETVSVPAPVHPTVEARTLETIKVGSVIHHRWVGDKLVLFAESVFETRPVAPPPAAARETRLVNLNTATVDEIDRELAGVGPVMARRIVDARPFRSVDDLRNISGVGPKRFETLAPLVTVR